ncbi:MAG: hypothetical protein P0Y64_05730 [Candidatus Sphingomonas colombiensis]|nr:hypothetical protein [Sphingomonas sp.]WEK44308.1 MAG: hypothetical protein P0Y64_05730 [Sphingomonas sp.]
MTSGINRAIKVRASNWRSHGDVLAFRSTAVSSAVEELEKQVERARKANVLRVPNFDDQYWPLVSRARASDAGAGGLHFTIAKAVKGSRLPPFPEPFFGFAKVMVCAFEGRSDKGFSASNLQAVVSACRWLYSQFGQRPPQPHLLVHGDFEAAAQAAKSELGEGAANIGSKLAFIALQMDDMRLAPAPIEWRNSIGRKAKHNAIGAVADRRRDELMPRQEIIDALADLSGRGDLDERDLFIQRGIELCVSGGFRVNELLTLPRDCLHSEPELDDMGVQVLDRFGNPCERIGLRHWPEKGAHTLQIKWVPSVMNDVVKRAVADLQRISEPTWRAATHQVAFPDKTLLGDAWDEIDDDAWLPLNQIVEIAAVTDPYQFVRDNDMSLKPVRPESKRGRCFRMGDLRRVLYRKSERGEILRSGEGSQYLHDSLFIIPKFFVKRSMDGGLRGTVSLLKDANINVYLVGITGAPSIFERLGYLDEDGRPLRCPSHQIRHWLNTLALEGGLSDVDLARWMSRQNVAQNRAYDHRSPVQRAKRVSEKLMTGEAAGPVAQATRSIKDPVRREEFVKSVSRTAHVTDLGICVHPWDALPCQKHGSCSDCGELRVEKGNVEQRERAAKNLIDTEADLAIAFEEEADGTINADRWVDAHERMASSLKKIIAIHDDPSIPDGHIVQVDQRPAPVTH